MALIISKRIAEKLRDKHGVSEREVEQCFDNRDGPLVEDDSEDHKTDPPTQWFIAPTNAGRLLKVAFVRRDNDVYLKSAYNANATWIANYEAEKLKES